MPIPRDVVTFSMLFGSVMAWVRVKEKYMMMSTHLYRIVV